MIKKISYILIIILMLFMTFSCKEEIPDYKVGDEVVIDGIKYKLYLIDDLGYIKSGDYYNPDGTLKNIDPESIYIKNDDRVGYLHRFYYYDMINLDKYPDLTVDVIQDAYRNKIVHRFATETSTGESRTDNIVDYYPNHIFYIDENGLAQNGNYFFSTDVLFDRLYHEGMYWFIIGYDQDKVKEDTIIPHRIGQYATLGIAYKGLEGAPMRTLTIEAPSDEEMKTSPDGFSTHLGNYSYKPFLYYPYAISNCPNLVSITAFNGYFMPLSISNIPNKLEINLASREDIAFGFFALDAAFYNLKISKLTTNPLNHANIRGAFNWGNVNGDETYYSGAAGNYNLVFTNCKIYEYANSTRYNEFSPSEMYLDEEGLSVKMLRGSRQVLCVNQVGYLSGQSYLENPIRYDIFGLTVPNIVDGVCHSAYNDYILERYKGVKKVVVFREPIDYNNTFWGRPSEKSKYYAEDGYIKVYLHGKFYNMSKCKHTDKYDIKCVCMDYSYSECVLTLCKIDENSTYVVVNGDVIYAPK